MGEKFQQQLPDGVDIGLRPPVFLNISCSIRGTRINLQEWPQVNGQMQHHSWEFDMEDPESFILPPGLHQSTKNMLIGVGQRLNQLWLYGFEREP